MASVVVELPAVLAPVLGREATIELPDGATLADAFDRIVAHHPRLAVHLFDESGTLREHVLCFWNGTNTRWLESLDVALAGDDRLTVMQAVSGG